MADGDGDVAFEGLDWWDGFGLERPARAGDGDGGEPVSGVEGGCVPAGGFEAGVEVFAAVNGAKGDGAGGGLPGGVGGDGLAGAVGEGEE